MAETIKIGGELENIATGNVVAAANAIEDKAKGKKQSQINEETDTALANRYTKSETYSKTQLDNMITTPNQEYVSVTATSQTTSATDVLPATGEADTVYRVGNWDGSQFDASVYSEYAWNGSAYVLLDVKTQVGEIYDISANHADTKYADLAAALGANGANIPQSLQKGGMSIKFIQSSDNKYVQYRLMPDTFSTTESDWQGVDDEPTAGSDNLVKSGGVFDEFYTQLQLKDQNCTITSNQDYPKELLGFTLKQGKKYNIKLTIVSGITWVSGAAFIQIWENMTSSTKKEYKVSTSGSVTSNQVVLDTVYQPEQDMTAFRLGSFIPNGVVKVIIDELDIEKYATKEELNTFKTNTEASIETLNEDAAVLNEKSADNDEAMSIYPETEKTITYSDGWLQGYRRGNTGAAVVSSSAYITSNLINLKKGDIIKFPDTNGLSNVFIIATDGSVIIEFNYNYANVGNRFPYYVTDDVDVYFDVRNPDGITPSSAKPLYIVRQVDALKPIADTTKIVKEIVGSQDEVWSEQNGKLIAARIGRGVSAGDDRQAGIEVPSNQYFITPFIPVKVGDEFVGASCDRIFKYSSAQNLESAFISFEDYLVNGNVNEIRIIRYKVTQTDWNNGVRFIRAELNNTESSYPGKAFSKLAEGDFKILCLGDSQFGKITKPYDFPSWIQKETGFKAVNSGFGGTTACRHAASGDPYDYNEDIYNRLSLYNLADCIATGNFTSIDIDWGDSGDNDYDFNPKIQFLKEIDYSKLKLITFAYGGNDWNGDHALDNTENKYDKATYLGSLRYSIERILNAYPNIQIALLSPTWRCGKSLVSGNYVIDWTTDEKENLNGKLTMDFVEGMKSVAEEYHLPFFDNYTNLGINRFNEAYYIGDNPIDGSHYKWIAGGEYVGRRIAQEVMQVLSKN